MIRQSPAYTLHRLHSHHRRRADLRYQLLTLLVHSLPVSSPHFIHNLISVSTQSSKMVTTILDLHPFAPIS